MNDKFKTVTSGLGYNHNHMTRGHNVKVFHGVECPRCKHQFLPTLVDSPAKCPACGFEETASAAFHLGQWVLWCRLPGQQRQAQGRVST